MTSYWKESVLTRTNDAAAPPALVVGTGFGCRIHVPALRAAGFNVVGLVGADADRTQRRAERNGVPRAFTDLDEAITRSGAVVVTIATPPKTHAPLVLAALSRGCHVVCEKPFALNAGEARAMLGAAERAGVVNLVGHEFRWMTERALMGRAIAHGVIGKPRFVSLAQYTDLVADPNARWPPWWFDKTAGGGWLGASGSHVIDQVRNWLGEFASVSADLPIVSAREDVAEDSFLVRFRLANEVPGILQSTGGAWGPFAGMTRIAGTDGTLWIESGIVWLADREGPRELTEPPELKLESIASSGEPRDRYKSLELPPYIRLCESLRAAIDGRPASSTVLPATFADGVACMEVLDAIRESAANGGALVKLGPVPLER
jgi:predicted dehydrogenase